MKIRQIHFPTVSAFMHALGRDDVRHPLIEVIHLDDLADCSSFGNTRYTFGFYCVVYKDARCGTVRYGATSTTTTTARCSSSPPTTTLSWARSNRATRA